jgi:hypothetical protein
MLIDGSWFVGKREPVVEAQGAVARANASGRLAFWGKRASHYI